MQKRQKGSKMVLPPAWRPEQSRHAQPRAEREQLAGDAFKQSRPSATVRWTENRQLPLQIGGRETAQKHILSMVEWAHPVRQSRAWHGLPYVIATVSQVDVTYGGSSDHLDPKFQVDYYNSQYCVGLVAWVVLRHWFTFLWMNYRWAADDSYQLARVVFVCWGVPHRVFG